MQLARLLKPDAILNGEQLTKHLLLEATRDTLELLHTDYEPGAADSGRF